MAVDAAKIARRASIIGKIQKKGAAAWLLFMTAAAICTAITVAMMAIQAEFWPTVAAQTVTMIPALIVGIVFADMAGQRIPAMVRPWRRVPYCFESAFRQWWMRWIW